MNNDTTPAGGNETKVSSSSNSSQQQPPVNNNDSSSHQDSTAAAQPKGEPRELGPKDTPPVPYVQPGEEVLQLQDIGDSAMGADDSASSEAAASAVIPNMGSDALLAAAAAAAAPSRKSTKPKAPKSTRARFPDKLHRLLDDCSDDTSSSAIVSWMGQRAFKVHQPKQFAATILPKYFATTTYKSFQRNLNLWGFTCIAKGPRRGVCFHPFFVKGNEEDLSSHMKRSGDPAKLLQQRDQQIPQLPPPTGENSGGASDPAGIAPHLSALAAGTLPSSGGNFFHHPSPFRPFPMQGGGAAAAALGRLAGAGGMDNSNKLSNNNNNKRGIPAEVVTSDDASSSTPIKKRKATVEKSPGGNVSVDLSTSQQQAHMALVQVLLQRQQQRGQQSADGLAALQGGVNIQHLLGMANRGGGTSNAPGNEQLDSSQRSGSNSNSNINQLLAMATASRSEEASQALAALGAGVGGSGPSFQQLSEMAARERAAAGNAPSGIQQFLASQAASAPGAGGNQLQQLLALVGGGDGGAGDLSRGYPLVGAAGVSPQFELFFQQQQQQPRPGAPAIADLVASLEQDGQGQIPSHLLQQPSDQALLALLQGQQLQPSLEQRLLQEQQSLQDAMKAVQQQQQKLALLELQRRQQQQQQPQSIHQLLAQLQGGASIGPPPLQLPPSALPQQQRCQTFEDTESTCGQNATLQQQIAKALQGQHTQLSENQDGPGLSSFISSSGQSLQLQQLLQSLGSGGSAPITALPSGGNAAILAVFQQQQAGNLPGGNQQQLLQLLQLQQQQEANALKARLGNPGPGTGPNNDQNTALSENCEGAFNHGAHIRESHGETKKADDGDNVRHAAITKKAQSTSQKDKERSALLAGIVVTGQRSARLASSRERNFGVPSEVGVTGGIPSPSPPNADQPPSESPDQSGKSFLRAEWDALLLQRPRNNKPSSRPVADWLLKVMSVSNRFAFGVEDLGGSSTEDINGSTAVGEASGGLEI